MTFDELFEKRSFVGSQLKDYISDNGYTKFAFSNETGISRPTLDKLLNGDIDSKTSFDRHMHKILEVLNISVEELVFYNKKPLFDNLTIYSQNAPDNHIISDRAKNEYDLVLDLVELCAIYY
ncbi:MAG: helix-turn-helix domain-containing protein [Erysipelotrichaceae bacterium]